MTQLLFNKDSDFLAADSFQLKQDGTIEVRNGNWIGGLWPGFTRTDEDDNEYDSWAKFCELRDNGTITVQPVPQSELDAIAACIIGGASFFGGRGTVLGVFAGVMIMGILRNGLNLMDVSSFWQQVLIGSIIVIAVYIDVLRRDLGTRK